MTELARKSSQRLLDPRELTTRRRQERAAAADGDVATGIGTHCGD